jgi:hypothetical protein
MLSLALLCAGTVALAPEGRAASAFSGSSGLTLTLTSVTSFGTLGVNVFVTSSSKVDSSSASQTGAGSSGFVPTFSGPSGNWVINSSLGDSASATGSAGDVIGDVASALATSSTITLKNFSDADTTFTFAWSLNLDALVIQSGQSPTTDTAAATASFSLTDDLGAVLIPSGLVSANTSVIPGHASDVRSGTLTYTVRGGLTRVLTAHVDASGSATAFDEAAPDIDGDGVEDAADNCVTVPNTDQADGDGDAVGDLCDSCVAVANPRVAADFLTTNSWATLTGGQRDDDHDGYGNRCDAKFPGVTGTVVNASDLVQFRASNGKNRTLDVCGTTGTRPCAIFDLDEATTVIGAGDLTLFRQMNGKSIGPKCATCPLACEAGASGTCGAVP